jgi:hypothetical protein
VNGNEVTDEEGPVNGGIGPSQASCPSGTTLVGGGTLVTPTPPAAGAILMSYPVPGNVWVGEGVRLTDGGSISVIAWALCAAS